MDTLLGLEDAMTVQTFKGRRQLIIGRIVPSRPANNLMPFLKVGHSRPLFIYFRLFNTVDNKQMLNKFCR